MKKSLSLLLAVCMLLVMVMCPAVYAAGSRSWDSGNPNDPYDSGGGIEISTDGGKEIRLIGHVSPTIISVTMPSYIPFDISAGVVRENKVVSPVITVENQSAVPVTISVDNTKVDLSKLSGSVDWKTDKNVGDNGLAVGFTKADTEPSNLDGAMWLADGAQNLPLMDLGGNGEGTLFVVGAIGGSVPQDGTFTVTPTLVVKKAAV